mmetsp:Transcript_102573/g.257044  ORF Transcript_102573/g.257044 Transcript_102573/m.257044 type:complete len:313 (-) Transcript_102573:71-1009(-)
MAGLDNPTGNLGEERLFSGDEFAAWLPVEELIANINNLIKEEIVKNTIRTHHNDVALIGRHAMHSTSTLDHLDRHSLVEVGVDTIINSANLEWALRIAIDALHLRVEDGFQVCFVRVDLALQVAEDKNLAVANGEHCNHWVQLAMDDRAIIQYSEQRRRGTQCLGGFISLPHQRDRTPVEALWHLHVLRHQLLHRELLASLEQLLRQFRRVQTIFCNLGDAVGDADEHGGNERDVRINVAFCCLSRVGLLVGTCIEAKGLVLLVLLRQVLLSAVQLLEVVPLPLRTHKEGWGATERTLHVRHLSSGTCLPAS